MSEENKQAVGAQIPYRLNQLINLHSVVKNKSKSQILRDALFLWIEENGVDLEILISELALEIKAKWLRSKNDLQEISSKSQFLEFQAKELHNKKIPYSIIEKVFHKINLSDEADK